MDTQTIVEMALTGYAALVTYIWQQEKTQTREHLARLDVSTAKLEIADRDRAMELTKQEGEMNRLRDGHVAVKEDLKMISDEMATKEEVANIKSDISDANAKLDRLIDRLIPGPSRPARPGESGQYAEHRPK